MQNAVHEKKRIALISLFAAVLLTALKLLVGLKTNSLGILSEAAHSGLDLIAALITYIAVSVSDKPADKDHHFGHGKFENVSAFAETILLIFTCGWIIWGAVNRLLSGAPHVDANIWGFIVIAFAVVVDYGRSRALYRAAKKYNSQALEADALHFSSDIWSSLVVLSGLVFVRLGFPWFDSVAAIGVAVLVLFVSYRLGRRTIDALVDRVPPGVYEKVLASAKSVAGVEDCKDVRLRTAGATIYIDLTILIKRITPFYLAHDIMDKVEASIRCDYPNADIIVHGEPFISRDETVAEKVRMAVIAAGLAEPHNLRVNNIGGRYYIDFHLEQKTNLTLDKAHETTDQIESRIREEIGEDTVITIHLEELYTAEKELKDATAIDGYMADDIRRFIMEDKTVLGCSDIILLKSGSQYDLSLTCHFAKTIAIGEVHHIIHEIESRLRDKFTSLDRITIHPEPV